MENMEKVLIDHEVHTVKKSRWEENDDIERYKILNDDQDILGIDEYGKFHIMEDNFEYGNCDSVTCIFLDYDLAYDLAYQYEQTERHRLIREEREKLYKKEHGQEFPNNTLSYGKYIFYDEDEAAISFLRG